MLSTRSATTNVCAFLHSIQRAILVDIDMNLSKESSGEELASRTPARRPGLCERTASRISSIFSRKSKPSSVSSTSDNDHSHSVTEVDGCRIVKKQGVPNLAQALVEQSAVRAEPGHVPEASSSVTLTQRGTAESSSSCEEIHSSKSVSIFDSSAEDLLRDACLPDHGLQIVSA